VLRKRESRNGGTDAMIAARPARRARSEFLSICFILLIPLVFEGDLQRIFKSLQNTELETKHDNPDSPPVEKKL
jgi:hypothetical protein